MTRFISPLPSSYGVHLILGLIVCHIVFLVAFSTSVSASEFSTTYDITYTVDAKGVTTADQKVILKNNFDHLQATKYSLIIGSTKLTEIQAGDDFGAMDPKVEVLENSTAIHLEFEEPVIGKNKQRNIITSYMTPDFASVKGKVLEVGFPLLSNSQDLDHYTVTLRIPTQFGKPSHLAPKPTQIEAANQYQVLYFSETDLEGLTSITAKFGTEQIVDFTLRYTLENPQVLKGRIEVALPPDTNYQEVLYWQITPQPRQLHLDHDGNWLAEYLIEPKANLQVVAQGTVKLHLKPQPTYARKLTEQEQQLYTKQDQFWPVPNPEIQSLAKSLKTPRGIYDYLVQNFIYDYGRLTKDTSRLGADYALAHPSNAICMEFTDTFITLSRALGIPARELNGFGYTENEQLRPLSLQQDILHAWPEYWDAELLQWIQVDPTWGNTTGGLDFFDTFDLDHITFVIHGVESTYPLTPGSYKTKYTEGKDVEVTFGEQFDPVEKIEVSLQEVPSGITGLPNRGKLTLYNRGNRALYQLPLGLELHENTKLVWKDTQTVEVLLPFSSTELDWLYYPSWQHPGGRYVLTSQALDEKTTITFTLSQPIKPIWIAWALGGGLGGGLWIAGYWGTRNWQKRKKRELKILEEEMLENSVPNHNEKKLAQTAKL